MTGRAVLLNLLAVLATSLVVIGGLLYAQVSKTYDATTLVVSVVAPLIFGCVVLSIGKNRALLFSFLAYFWAVVDDAPVYFDSVLTWPEITRFHPFLPRLLMNVGIHLLTLIFLYLAIRESLKGTGLGVLEAPEVVILAFLAFVLAYAQNIPMYVIQLLVETSWYQFDLTEKLASIFLLCLAFWEAARLKSTHRRVGVERNTHGQREIRSFAGPSLRVRHFPDRLAWRWAWRRCARLL